MFTAKVFGSCLLSFTILFVVHGSAKPTPGNHLRLSLREAPPAALVPVPFGFAAPIVAHNLPLDAATASQRVDIYNRYAPLPLAPPLKLIASPYVQSPYARFAAVPPYAVPSPYYTPNVVVGPFITPTAQLRYAPPAPLVYPGPRVFIR